jgi:hypothetical protein
MLELPMLSFNCLGWLEIPAPSSKNSSCSMIFLQIFLHALVGFVQVSAKYLPAQ